MFRFIAICALATIAAAAPGFVEQHVVAAPVVAKVGHVVHSAPVATSHQSFTQVHSHAVITPVIKHVAPVVTHVAPVVPVVKHVAPVVHHQTYVAPVVPVVKHVAPVVHHQTYVAPAVSVVKTLPHTVSHQSHTQVHHQKTIITPVVAPVVPVVKHVAVAPISHVYHH
ncbi:uncharacterized protein LOC6558275 [Drosophila grimshawi]|nr:uncharacterized protein LOC6558275 [Drosophila grimshawi]